MRVARGCALLLSIGFSTVFLTAQVQAKASEKPPSSDYSKEAYVIEKVRTTISVENDGTNTRVHEAQVKILADAGVKAFAVLSFTYTSTNETVDIEYVRVRKPDGTVVKTPDYNVQDMPADVTRTAPLYSDIHEKHVTVKALAVGDVLEYRIHYRVLKPEVPGHFWFEDSFTQDAIVQDERLEINVPSGKYLKVVSPDFKPESREMGGRRTYIWTYSNLVRRKKDPTETPKRTLPDPSVQVTTFSNWEEVGRWYAGLQKDPLEVTPAIQAKTAELTKGLQTEEEKVRAIYNFVSLNIHYVGLDFGIGRYQPHAADDVLGNGYGDCKDKHILFTSLLKAAGYDAWPALIHSARKLDPEVPSPAQFNHVITVVPITDHYIWLDTTPEVAPYGLLLTLLRDKQALVIPSAKSPLLMKTPKDAPFPQQQIFSAEGKLDAEGTYTAHVEQTYRGDVETVLRSGLRQVSESQWKEALQRFSYALGFAGDVSNVTITPINDTEKPLHVSYDYVRKNYGEWENGRITLPFPPMGVEANKDTKKPQEPVLLGGVGEIAYHAKLTLPPGYTAVVPKTVDLSRPYADYRSAIRTENGVLTGDRRLVIKQAEVALDSWDDYRDFGKAVSDDESTYIYVSGEEAGTKEKPPANIEELDSKFREAGSAQQQRDFTRAAELYREVLAGYPKYQGAHFNLGLALAAQNKITEAIEEFRKEQEIDPKDARAYEAPAGLLTFLRQSDEAIREWRKLLKVDPKNRDAALNLSALLTADGKDPDATAVLEDAVKESPDSPSLEMALGRAYVTSKQYDQGVAHMRKALENTGGQTGIDPMMLNDAAYVLAEGNTHLDVAKEFAEKAVAELDKRSIEAANSDSASVVLGKQFAATWDTLGWVYFHMGDFNRALSFVHAAWVLGQNIEVGDHLGQINEKLGRPKEAKHVYELALRSYAALPPREDAGNEPSAYQKPHDQVLSHYKKLTGADSEPMGVSTRLPNGEWTKTPAEELQDSLIVKVRKTTDLNGVAVFSLVFTPAKLESARYQSGDEQLQSLAPELKSTRFPMEFPVGSTAKIVRRVRVSCDPAWGCKAALLLPNQAQLGIY